MQLRIYEDDERFVSMYFIFMFFIPLLCQDCREYLQFLIVVIL